MLKLNYIQRVSPTCFVVRVSHLREGDSSPDTTTDIRVSRLMLYGVTSCQPNERDDGMFSQCDIAM